MNHKILIVDDEPNILMSLEFLLKKEGFEIDTAADGDAALEKIRSFNPHLVLLDVMMPNKSGFEVCEIVRADSSMTQPKIIMLTAKGRDTEQTKGLALGADAYMLKPFSTKDLVIKIREVLG